MSELLNIEILLHLNEELFGADLSIEELIPESVGWSGKIGDALTIDVGLGEEKNLGLRRWALRDVEALPKDVLLCLEVEPKVHWQNENMIFTRRADRLEMSVSVDLGSALHFSLLQLESWFIEQFGWLIPLGAFVLFAGPELLLRLEASNEKLIADALNDYSNVLWAVVPTDILRFDSLKFEILSEPLPGFQLLRKRDISQMYRQWKT